MLTEVERRSAATRMSVRRDSLSHLGDPARNNEYGLCGARIKGIPANPAPDRQCGVCADLMSSRSGRFAGR